MEDSLLYGLVTLAAGLLALIVRYMFRSKCVEVSICWGLFKIQRDIEHEVEQNDLEIHRQRSSNLEISRV